MHVHDDNEEHGEGAEGAEEAVQDILVLVEQAETCVDHEDQRITMKKFTMITMKSMVRKMNVVMMKFMMKKSMVREPTCVMKKFMMLTMKSSDQGTGLEIRNEVHDDEEHDEGTDIRDEEVHDADHGEHGEGTGNEEVRDDDGSTNSNSTMILCIFWKNTPTICF